MGDDKSDTVIRIRATRSTRPRWRGRGSFSTTTSAPQDAQGTAFVARDTRPREAQRERERDAGAASERSRRWTGLRRGHGAGSGPEPEEEDEHRQGRRICGRRDGTTRGGAEPEERARWRTGTRSWTSNRRNIVRRRHATDQRSKGRRLRRSQRTRVQMMSLDKRDSNDPCCPDYIRGAN